MRSPARLDVAVEQHRGGAEAGAVRGGDALDPAVDLEVVRGDEGADALAQHLHAGAGHRVDARRRAAPPARRRGRVRRARRGPHVLRAVGVQVDAGGRRLHGASDVEVRDGRRSVAGRSPARRSPSRRGPCASDGDRRNVLERERARRSHDGSARGEVAVDDDAHRLADRVAPHVVGGGGERVEVLTRRRAAASPHSASSRASGSVAARLGKRAHAGLVCGAPHASGRVSPLRCPFGGSRAPNRAESCTAASPGVGVGERGDGASQSRGRVQVSASWMYSGCAVRRSRSSNPSSAVRALRSRECGHGRSGLTWSAVSGDTPPQSSVPARTSRSNSVGSDRFGGTCIAHARAHHQPRRPRPRRRTRGGRHRAHPASRCGASRAEVLDDDLLHVPVTLVRLAEGDERLGAVAQGLADADQDAGGEGHADAACVLDDGQPHARGPCRASRSAPAPAPRTGAREVVSSIMPIDGATGRRAIRSSSVRHHAGVEVREQSGLAA